MRAGKKKKKSAAKLSITILTPLEGGLQPVLGISPGPGPWVPYSCVAFVGASGTRLYLKVFLTLPAGPARAALVHDPTS